MIKIRKELLDSFFKKVNDLNFILIFIYPAFIYSKTKIMKKQKILLISFPQNKSL